MNKEIKRNWLLLLAIFILALNLRPAIAAIGPLVNQIIEAANIDSAGIGLLTTIPVFFMGFGAIYVRQIRVFLGEKRGIAIGGCIIAVACLSRAWLDTSIGLMISAVGAGIGIAIVQCLIPSFIKRNFGSSTGQVIALYSTGIVSGAAISAGSAGWLTQVVGWSDTLALWSAPSALAVIFWLVTTQNTSNEDELPNNLNSNTTHKKIQFWRSSRCWSLVAFFGVGTGAFMLVMAWIPPFYVDLGQTREKAGLLLSVLTIIEALTALAVAGFIHHFPDRRIPLLLALLITSAGFLCLIMEPVSLEFLAVSLLGIGIGVIFPLSIIVAIDHIEDPTTAGDFTSFVQGGGFIVASLIPLLAGGIRDTFDDLSSMWMLMSIGSIAMILLVVRYSPKSYKTFWSDLKTKETILLKS